MQNWEKKIAEQWDLIVCSSESKTTHNFKSEFHAIIESIPYITRFFRELEKKSLEQNESRFHNLVHNLKTLNGRCIQEFNNLGFSTFDNDVKASIEKSRLFIEKNSSNVAHSLYNLMKFEGMVKVEMQVYELMLNGNTNSLDKDYHNIRDVIMLTLHKFFFEFNQKNVYVELEDNYHRVYFIYEIIACSVYYIIDNATKYVKPGSHLKIFFSNSVNSN